MKRICAFILVIGILFSMGAACMTCVAAEQTYRYGDVNFDNSIDAKDALTTLKYAVYIEELTSVQCILGDVNKDTTVDAKDALDILKFAVDKIDSFEAGEFYTVVSTGEVTTANSVNGAYEQDATADCSFVMDNTGLESNTIYVVTKSCTTSMNVDQQRLLYSLQGLINRDFGMDDEHTSILYVSSDQADVKWLQYMQEDGSVYTEMKKKHVNSWDEFFEFFEHQIAYCGIIVWDGNVPSTSNVAATICGLDGYLPVLNQSPLHTWLLDRGIQQKQSLANIFKDNHKGETIPGSTAIGTGSAKNDAYLWALEKYFDRCSANYLAYILDGACTVYGYDAYPNNPVALLKDRPSNCLSNHDYLIARRCFFFDLNPYAGEKASDDPAQANGYASVDVDNQTMLKIFKRRFERANGSMGQLMGFPPWWLKYTDHNGQASKPGTWIEWLFTEYISCYNLAKEADAAHPCSMTNGSAYYKYIPKQSSYDNNFEEYYQDSGLSYNSSTYYYTIYLGDYDSSAWLKKYVYDFWMQKDRVRGQLPLTWCFNPNLSNRVPMVFDYIYENKYANEFIAAGDSGAGYVMPSGLLSGTTLSYSDYTRPAENGDGTDVWVAYCKKFYERFDIKATGFIINGDNSYSSKIYSMYNQFSTMGSLHNGYNVSKMGTYQGVPYIYCHNGISDTTDPYTLYSHVRYSSGGYKFSAFRTICLSPTKIQTIVNNFDAYAAGRGIKTQYVELYSFLKLAKESGRGATLR